MDFGSVPSATEATETTEATEATEATERKESAPPSSDTLGSPVSNSIAPPTVAPRRDPFSINALQWLQRFGSLAALIILVIVASILSPTFLTGNNIRPQLQLFAVQTALISAGQTLVILTGGIDLSVGSLLAVGSTLAAQLAIARAPLILIIALPILLCGAIGTISGTIIARTRIQPIVVTLAMLIAARGVARLIGGNHQLDLSQLPDTVFAGNLNTVVPIPGIATIPLGPVPLLGAIPLSIALVVIVYLAVSLFLTRTVPGRYVFAVGGNERAARLSGVAADRVKVTVYAISGLLAGLAGVLFASSYQNADPANDATLFELTTIAAVVVGGTSLLGGTGGVWRTLVGGLILVVLNALFIQLGLPQPTQLIAQGLIIVGAVALQAGSSS